MRNGWTASIMFPTTVVLLVLSSDRRARMMRWSNFGYGDFGQWGFLGTTCRYAARALDLREPHDPTAKGKPDKIPKLAGRQITQTPGATPASNRQVRVDEEFY